MPDAVCFVLTVDTEEEWDWKGDFPRKNFSVSNALRIPRFQAFCRELGIKPTYLIDYPILDNPLSAEPFRHPLENGECEIAAHLHPWANPPHKEEVNGHNSHAVNLPRELVQKKLDRLTNKIRDVLGIRPRAFRSGRWGMNETLLKELKDLGYDIETSVRPFFATDSFSYHNARDQPYWPDYSRFLSPGSQREILEMPVSVGFNRKNFPLCDKIHRGLSAGPWKHLKPVGILWHSGLLRKLHLSPEQGNAAQMKDLCNVLLEKKGRFFNMFLHSSSLLPGCNPYVRTKEDAETFYRDISEVVEYLQSRTRVLFCTLSEAKSQLIEEQSL